MESNQYIVGEELNKVFIDAFLIIKHIRMQFEKWDLVDARVLKVLKKIGKQVKMKEVNRFKWINLDVFIEDNLDDCIIIKEMLQELTDLKLLY